MPNARQTSLIASPSSSRATNRRRSSITEHSFHGIDTSPGKGKGVTHVSGTICHLCLGPLSGNLRQVAKPFLALAQSRFGLDLGCDVGLRLSIALEGARPTNTGYIRWWTSPLLWIRW